MANRWHIAAVIVTGGALAGAGLAMGVLAVDRRATDALGGLQTGDEASKAAAAVVARAEQAFMAEVTAAAAIPQLRFALHSRVDAATLEDLFASEDWWAPYRELSVAIVTQTGVKVSRPAHKVMPETEIATRARVEGTVAAIKQSAGVAKLIGAAPLADAAGSPVLTFARAVDAALVSEWAHAAGTPLAVTDGQRLIAASDDEVGRLPLAGHERDGTFPSDARFVTAPSALGGDLWLWIARVRQPASAVTRLWMWGLVALALVVAVILALVGGRSATVAAAPRDLVAGPAPMGSGRPEAELLGDRMNTGELGGGGSGTGLPPLARGKRTGFSTSSGILRRFGRYELIERIDEGGMSDIFTATMRGAKGFERVLVIKRLKRELSANRAAIEQFVDEARLGSQLVHPNIAQVYDFGELDDGYFMALEYVPGRNVSQIVERHLERMGRGLDLSTVFYLAHDVLQALSYAHDRRNANGDPLGVVHRDVSPANVMVSTRGDVKLLDFGIVKSDDRISHSDIANIKGNPAFMAPEQARGQPVDARSDLFSVGLFMYYALTGQIIYRIGSAGETLFQAATGPTREQMEGILSLPQPAARIIARALGTEPEDRFRNAEEFAAAVAPEVRQGARTHMANLLQSLFGFEFQLENGPAGERHTPVRPRAV